MKHCFSFILDLLFPPRCAVCNDITLINTALCENCFEHLSHQLEDIPLCSHCGKPVNSCVCHYGLSFEKCVSVFEYCSDTRHLIELLKTDPSSAVSKQLAEMMAAQFYKSDLCNIKFDCITSVPESNERLAGNKYGHAECLAKKLSEKLGITYLPSPIKRSKGYKPQHNLSRAERKENVRLGYFTDSEKSLSGNILLADDIITTGATLDHCALLLKSLGADNVYCITAATTFLKDEEYSSIL